MPQLRMLALPTTLARKQTVQVLPQNQGRWVMLRYLRLSCRVVRVLPNDMLHSKQLEHLNLTCENVEELPDPFSNFCLLTHLDLGNCDSLTQLPDQIAYCGQLQHLSIRWCTDLKGIPDDISGCSKLVRLDADWCYSLEALPADFGECTALTALRLYSFRYESRPSVGCQRRLYRSIISCTCTCGITCCGFYACVSWQSDLVDRKLQLGRMQIWPAQTSRGQVTHRHPCMLQSCTKESCKNVSDVLP